ncbi:MAG: hypothetical protein Q9159_003383 [Coniocarpon cinnabarinum]
MTKVAPGQNGDQEQARDTTSPASLPNVQVEQADHSSNQVQYSLNHSSTDISESDPPPAYGDIVGQMHDEQDDLGTHAHVADDGRVNIHINQKGHNLSNIFHNALHRHNDKPSAQEPYIPPPLASPRERTNPPKLNVVIHVVGSRGDVQPFVSLAKVLKEQYGHRVRLATHPVFRDFVTSNDIDFFSIGGDPSQLMAFMVKNPGLMPGFDSLRSGDVGTRRKEIAKMVKGCWRSCIESGDGTGPEVSDNNIGDWANADNTTADENLARPFVADAIIANPPSFAHVHCAEKLGIPLHMMFTMPWSPTQAFPHPLANIQSSNADASMTNFMTYTLVDMMTWQGLGDVINGFRRKSLGLDPISLTWAPGMLARLQIPWTYCWSPALIPKPRDWQQYISISGFYFLDQASNFEPEQELKAFLEAGPPPVYIGFGSIVVEDPNAMTNLIFEAVKETGQRALVSKGWGGFGAEDIGIPDGVYMLGNIPHDWLFQRVSAVVHHGGAGTTAAGIAAGKPTVIVPFFGDQPFWGSMVHKAGAGPMPIPNKKLTADALATAITEALTPSCVEKAKELSARISKEQGSETGAEYFHNELKVDRLRCQLSPNRAAVWRIRRTNFRLSAFAATVLAHERLIDFADLKLYRSQELDVDGGPWDPISGGAGAVIGTMGSMAMGIADMPVATLKALKIHPDHRREAEAQAAQAAQSSQASTQSSQQASHSPAGSRPGSSSLEVTSQELKDSRADAMHTLKTRDSRSSSVSSSSSKSSGKEAAAAWNTLEKQKPFKFKQEDIETLLSTGKGAWKFTEAGVKSPLDFTLAMAKGFHNAPKLYGDETVRKSDKIVDLRTGLKAAGKEFGYGLYDGITGLVKQPMQGAKKEGPAGFVKGFGKGIGGITLKPGAAFWALPGFTAQGMYREIRNRFGPSVQGYLIAARTAQGYEEMQSATSEEYSELIKDWDDVKKDIKKKKHVGEEKMEEIKSRYRGARSRSRSLGSSCSERWNARRDRNGTPPEKEAPIATGRPLRHAHTAAEKDDESGEGPSERTAAIHRSVAGSRLSKRQSKQERVLGDSDFSDPEFETAVQQSVRETSRGDPEEDKAIERAIRASMQELEDAQKRGANHEELEQAIQNSLADARTGNLSRAHSYAEQHQHSVADAPADKTSIEGGAKNDGNDTPRVATASKSPATSHGAPADQATASPLPRVSLGKDLQNAVADSTFLASTEDENPGQNTQENTHQSHRDDTETTHSGQDEDEDLRRAIARSQTEQDPHGINQDDDNLKLAITQSLEHHGKDAADRQKAEEEEEVVMRYMLRQSQIEEDLRKGKSGEASGGASGGAGEAGKSSGGKE